jgi:mono/diheme cytochrome c family protein
MKSISLSLIVLPALLLLTCKSTKKSTASSDPPAVPSTPPLIATAPGILIRSADGIYAPGELELTAYQPYKKDVTLDKLSKGYSLYAQSACVQCHQAKNIYDIKATDWKSILDDMAQKANISAEQKDAVFDYVLAVKTVKLKQGK